MGLLYSRVNRPDEAVAALERAQQLAPGNAKYRQVLDALKQGN
jgi:cytochrome c-type biogenesis protein CcmH/NrfG